MDWTLFAIVNAIIVAMLVIDLGVFHRKAHAVGMREALTWTVVWVLVAFAFVGVLWLMPGWFYGPSHLATAIARGELPAGATIGDLGDLRSLQYVTGYLIEKALAVDNLFVFALLFTAFAVPAQYQHKLLFYGIVGALIMRFGCILAGVTLLERFAWIIYVFGGILIVTGIKMLLPEGAPKDPRQHVIVRLARRVLPVSDRPYDGRFFVRENGRLMVTTLFIVLLLVEFTDLVFAVDSIPAVLAVTNDAFIVYASNAFAILGLRSLYFALAGLLGLFHYLKLGLAAILLFVGGKMLAHAIPFKVPVGISLTVIVSILALAVIASLVRARLLARRGGDTGTTPRTPALETP